MKKPSGFEKYLNQTLKNDGEFKIHLTEAILSEPIATQLRVLRRFRNLSQVVLSKKIESPQSVLARLERHDANPRLKTLERLGKGWGPIWLLSLRNG